MKPDICILETNVKTFQREKIPCVYLKPETKGYGIRVEIKDKAILIIYVQSKILKVHAEKLKETFHYALMESIDTKLYQKEEKYEMIDLQERIDKKT